MKESRIYEVYEDRDRIYTVNLVPGMKVYDERLVRDGSVEYREWNPYKSKLGALIKQGCSNIFIRKGSIVLYLGSGSGTTVSHVSDMVGHEGFVFALDFAPRVMRDLIFLTEKRTNIAPLFADAHFPDKYVDRVCLADVVFQDVAQKDQLKIFLKNCDVFLKDGGFGILAVKARSIDIRKKPEQIFKEISVELAKAMTIVDMKVLEPFEKDHCVFVCKKK